MKSYRSLIALVFCCVFFALSPFLIRAWDRPGSQAVISWDVSGYWLYLPSFFYDDLGALSKYDAIIDTYHPANKDLAFIHPQTGRYVMNYPCGQALMELPAFAAGHIWARAAGYKVDGFSFPYQVSLLYWCILVSCAGLWLLRRLLLRYFDDWIVAVVLLVLCLATNYYNFVSFSVMTHAYLLTIYALILYLTDSFYADQQRRLWRVALIGLVSGLATITRPTEIICILIPLLWGIRDLADVRSRLLFFLHRVSVPVVYIGAAFIAALPQLLYWKWSSGHWIFFSYHGADKTFSFLRPHISDVLFSYRKGWFIYTPVMLLAVLGFYQLCRSYRQIFWCILIFSLGNLYLVSAWDCWWYGGSFSMRALVQSYALLMFPMSAFLSHTLRWRYLRYPVIAFLLFCCWLDMMMTYQANGPGIIDGENMNRAYYWRIFGQTDIMPDDKKLLDTDEEIPGRSVQTLHQVYDADTNGIYTDTMVTYLGRKVFYVDGDKPFTQKFVLPVSNGIHKGWYRAYATVYYPVAESNPWDWTQFYIGFYLRDKPVKEKIIHIQRITRAGEWREVFIDIQAPPSAAYDSVSLFFWNTNSKKAVYFRNIKAAYTADE